MLFSKGDHVILTDDVYGGTYRVITKVLNRFGIEHTFVDTTNLEKLKKRFVQIRKQFMWKHQRTHY